MKRMIVTTTSLVMLSLMLASIVQAQEVPHTINFQSVLRNDNGDLITDNFIDMQIRILDQNGDQLYAETQPGVLVVRGAVNIMIGEGVVPGSNAPTGGVPTDTLDPATGSKSLQVQFGSNTPIGPIEIGSVPYAMYAEQALSLDPNFVDVNIPGSFASQSELDSAISNFQNQITSEASTRATADTTLQNQINTINTNISDINNIPGVLSEAKIDPAIARDSEIPTIISNLPPNSISGTKIDNVGSIPGQVIPNQIPQFLRPFAYGTATFPSNFTGFNISSIQGAGTGCFKVIFGNPASSSTYTVSASRNGFFDGSIIQSAPVVRNKANASFDICAGGTFPGADFVVFTQ